MKHTNKTARFLRFSYGFDDNTAMAALQVMNPSEVNPVSTRYRLRPILFEFDNDDLDTEFDDDAGMLEAYGHTAQ